MKQFGIIISIILLVQILLIVGQDQMISVYGQGSTSSNPDYNNIPKNISGITCDKTEHLVYHNHTMLMLKNNDQNVTIPAGIGIVPKDCIFWLHTHDDSGIIHVESPYPTSFTLGQFMQVWNGFDNSSIVKNLMKNNTMDKVSILLENGTKVNTTENAKNIKLQNNAIVSINLDDRVTK